MSTNERTMMRVTSVVRKARRRIKPTSTPLTSPTSAPAASAIGMTTRIGQPSMLKSASVVKFASANTEPMLKSMPPARTTSVMPSVTSSNSPNCAARPISPRGVTRPGIKLPKTASVSARMTNGIAVSIQSFASTSPTTWSGMRR